MSAQKQRQFIRFSLDIPAIRVTRAGERIETVLHQISIGGCLAEWDEDVYVGDEFRLEIPLPNDNRLPLTCKALYTTQDNGIGARFLDITRFEQELLGRIISYNLSLQGLPGEIDPFAAPRTYSANEASAPRMTDSRRDKEELLEKIMSGDN